MFREFVHFLLTLAHLIFAEEVMEMKGSVLANSLNRLVEGQLLRYACKVKYCFRGNVKRKDRGNILSR